MNRYQRYDKKPKVDLLKEIVKVFVDSINNYGFSLSETHILEITVSVNKVLKKHKSYYEKDYAKALEEVEEIIKDYIKEVGSGHDRRVFIELLEELKKKRGGL